MHFTNTLHLRTALPYIPYSWTILRARLASPSHASLSLYSSAPVRPALSTCTTSLITRMTLSCQHTFAHDVPITTSNWLRDIPGIVRIRFYQIQRSFCLRLPNMERISQYHPSGHKSATFPWSTMIVPCPLLSMKTTLLWCSESLRSDISVPTVMSYVVLYWHSWWTWCSLPQFTVRHPWDMLLTYIVLWQCTRHSRPPDNGLHYGYMAHFAQKLTISQPTLFISKVFRSYIFRCKPPIRLFGSPVIRMFPVQLVVLKDGHHYTEFATWWRISIALHQFTSFIY